METRPTAPTFQRLKDQETEPQATWGDTTTESEDGHSCQVIGFTGAKGGVGTTTVALNVAMTLVQAGQKVIYVELCPHQGTAARLLRLPQMSAIGDLSAQHNGINQDVVTQLLMQHSTGLNLVCVSPLDQGAGTQVSTELFASLMQELKKLANYLVLDFPLEPSLPSIFFLNQCHILDLVMETDLICLALAKNQVEFIQSQNSTPLLLTPVNRSSIPPADGLHGIQDLVGLEVPALIPPASELCHTAGVKGLPIVCINPNSIPALQFVKLGERILNYFNEDESEAARNRRAKERRKTDRRNRGGW